MSIASIRYRILLYCIFCWLSIFGSTVAMGIYRIESLAILVAHPTLFNKKDLIVFDVDDVLIQQGLLSSGHRILVEICAPHVIRQLQGQGVKVVALTASHTGYVDYFKQTIEDWKIACLKGFSIDFSQSSPLVEPWPYEGHFLGRCELRTGHKNSTQVLVKSGMISSANYTKGSVLYAFLMNLEDELRPKRIIVIDDQMDNLLSIQAWCKKLGIEFIGLHYSKDQSVEGLTEQEALRLFSSNHNFQRKVEHVVDKSESEIDLDPFANNLNTCLLMDEAPTEESQAHRKRASCFDCCVCLIM